MLFEAFAGIVFGSLGAIPFIHPNLIMQTLGGFFGSSVSLAIFAVSVSVSHAFFSAAPSLMVINGFSVRKEGYDLAKIFKISLLALAASIAFLPVAYFLLPFLKASWGGSYKFLFLTIIISNFASEKGAKAAIAGICIFLLSGTFGTVTFFRSIVAEPLFPMLSGFFAVPALLLGKEKGMEGINFGIDFVEKINIGEQNPFGIFNDEKIIVLASIFASAISTLFPAMTVGVMLGLLMLILRDEKALLVAVPALLVSKVFFDLAAAGITGATRSYASVLALPLMEFYGIAGLLMVCGIALMAGCLAVAFCIKLEGKLGKLQAFIETEKMREAILAAIVLLVLLFGGVQGILITATSASLGILGQKIGAKRSYLMGALLVPALIFQFGISEDVKLLLF